MLHPEAPLVLRLILGLHIVAGTVALFAVPLALLVRKGGEAHRRFGRIFVVAMATVAVTAFVCGPYFHDYFLLLIAIFSSYLTFVGWRALARKRPESEPARWIDWFGAGLALAAGLGMIAMGTFAHGQFGDFTIVLDVLGAICAIFAGRSMLRFVRPPKARNAWLFEHFGMMLGAYIATVTAFSAVNFHFIHPIWIRWLWPTVAGSVVIAAYTRKYRTNPAPTPRNAERRSVLDARNVSG